MNTSETVEKAKTCIQWNEQNTYFIEVIYDSALGNVTQNKIWINNNLVWEIGDGKEKLYFNVIVK